MHSFAFRTDPDVATAASQDRDGIDAAQPQRCDPAAPAANDERALDARTLERAARAHRSLPWRRLAATALRHAVGLWSAWQRVQFARACERTLLRLDDRLLRDIGLDRSEIGSLGAEIAGTAEATRLWTRLRRMA